MKLVLKDVDSVEFAVKSLNAFDHELPQWGFEKVGEGKIGSTKSAVWSQGKIHFLLSEGLDSKSHAKRFVDKHGDGICNVSFLVDDADKSADLVEKRGATITRREKYELSGGTLKSASLHAFGDVEHTFVSRHGTHQLCHYIDVSVEKQPRGFGMFAVDHLTCNVPVGQLNEVASFYEKVFDFKNTRFFNINTGRTGLLSKVMENDEGTVKIPINEPSDPKSQIQEYLDINNGPGVQHLALTTGDIISTLKKLREKDRQFLDVPDTYYDEVPKRVKGVKEDMAQLQKNRILVDGDNSGYLLQIFSQNAVGPFFYEVIQRHGNKGFGEGNFKALFEAIERDQEKRGVL